MTPQELLSSLHIRGVRLVLDNDVIRYRAPQGTLTPADIAMLRQHKTALLWLLDRHQEKVALLAADDYPDAELERLAWLALGIEPPSGIEEAA